jgi:hypothetical protein
MAYRDHDHDYLFSGTDAFSVIEGRKQQIGTEIKNLDSTRILNTSIEDLSTYFEEKYKLETPELHDDKAVADQQETQIEVYDEYGSLRGDDRRIVRTGTRVELSIPFSGNGDLFEIQPSTFISMPPQGRVHDGLLIISVTGTQLSQERVKADLHKQLADIRQYLGWLKSGIDPFNAGIRGLARQQIEHRRQKLLADRNLVAGLGFPLKRRDDALQTYVAPIVRKRIEPTLPPASTKPYQPEPILDEALYRSILDTINNMALVMERSPSAFATMDEEDLRQHFLVQLNGQYEGKATGETFNYQGKTDILIRENGRNIFIAECKFWKGEKAFHETIEQILSYLSWRDTKAAIILFNRNKGFSGVIEKMNAAATAHPLRKSGPSTEGETRSRYVFGQKNDPSREIVLTLLAFDVPQVRQITS